MRIALLGVAAAAPLPTTWPAPHNTSTQCVHMLAKHKLSWLLEPFTCTSSQKTSNAKIILGTGLGGTGTKSRRHIMNISNLSSIHAGPLAEFLGKKWRWGNPQKPIPHKAVYYASRACLGGHHPLHWVPRVH